MNRKNIEKMEDGVWETEDGQDAKAVETEKFKQKLQHDLQMVEQMKQKGQKRGSKAKTPKRGMNDMGEIPYTIEERIEAINRKRITMERIRKLQKKVLQEKVFELSNWDETYERMEKKNVSIDKKTEDVINRSRKATHLLTNELINQLDEISKDIIFSLE